MSSRQHSKRNDLNLIDCTIQHKDKRYVVSIQENQSNTNELPKTG